MEPTCPSLGSWRFQKTYVWITSMPPSFVFFIRDGHICPKKKHKLFMKLLLKTRSIIQINEIIMHFVMKIKIGCLWIPLIRDFNEMRFVHVIVLKLSKTK